VTDDTTARPVPPFRLILPEGWEELPADRTGVDALIRRTSAVFASQHRPDLDSEMRRLLELALRRMRQAKAFAIYLQTTAQADPMPMSITASVAEGQLGGTLDRQVAALFREQGAQFLTDDQSIVRWLAEVTGRREVAGASSRVIDYLIPIPGTGRRRALQFTTTIALPQDPDAEDLEIVEALTELSDVMISTFDWEPQA
jgi:hypothetical protein